MAPSKQSRNKREQDYSNVGVAGRKTGITLQDTGVRDEHGLEPIDGIFSSPQKSPEKRNGVGHNTTADEEEDMDIGDSTAPEPAEVLSSRNRNGRPILPPPKARSPMKTTLNSSPRRSVGPMSSPVRDTSIRAGSHPPVNRRLDFSTTLEQPRQSIERSPLKSAPQLPQPPFRKSGKLLSTSGSGKKKVFNLTADSDEEDSTNLTNDNEPSSILTQENEPADEEDEVPNGNDFFQPMEDESSHMELVDEDEEQEEMVEEEPAEELTGEPVLEPAKKRGRPKKEPLQKSSAQDASTISKARVTYKTSRKRGISETLSDEHRINGTSTPELEPPAKKGGRPKKKQVQQSDAEEEPESTPIVAPVKGRPKGSKPPPSARNPNATITSAKKLNPATTPTPPPPEIIKRRKRALTVEHPPTKPLMPPPFMRPIGSRSLQAIRSGTPAEEAGARVLRSGRVSFQPLAFWRGERAVMSSARKDGQNLILPSVREVVRVDEVLDNQRKRAASRKPGQAKKKRRLQSVDEESEEEELEEGEELEPWEINPGILHAEVVKWDPDWNRGEPEDYESTVFHNKDLAFAPGALQAATREVRGAAFLYAKTLSLPFFGSGMVDIPPGGEKRTKKCGRMQMVFFVYRGRVKVNVSNVPFSVGKGGMWQVPRGEFPERFLKAAVVCPKAA
ncbi:MAG: hypothetical protein MMC33_002616 [Icmadophila ericetorum]|nr:hypothetical protein [Icmadophila ericetorum]